MTLEDIAKKFILKDDIEQAELENLTTRMVNYCHVNEKGFVVIDRKNLNLADRIMAVLCSRYLANQIQTKTSVKEPISHLVKADELAKMLGEKKDVIIARANELRRVKKILSEGRDGYKVAHYAIEEFIEFLEKEGSI